MDKLIRKEQIVQLREHDMNRGHNKSKTPVYPVTVPEAILGFDSLGGATKVETLPETGQAGIIYYNTEDSKYYVYTKEGFTLFGMQAGLPILFNPNPRSGDGVTPNSDFDIEPNIYYYFGLVGGNTPSVELIGPSGTVLSFCPSLNLFFNAEGDIAKSYVGRFTANVDNPNITLHGVHFPSEVPDIEAGHTYEFNVLYDTCLITDITVG